MNYRYHIVDVFSDTPFGGNQLAVLPDATGITTEGMQRIAREFNFAETTFVVPSESTEATCRVRIFTPRAEVAFAGHPTIGTACALVLGGHHGGKDVGDLVLEEGVGLVQVHVEKRGHSMTGMLTLKGPISQPGERPARDALARTLTVSPTEVIDGFFGSAGLPFCFARLASIESVDRAVIDKASWASHFASAWSPNLFFFSGELSNGSELYARMSAPALGIEEDPATGSACATLAGLLASSPNVEDSTFTLKVVQGVSMGRRSNITAVASKVAGQLVSVGVGGPTAYVSTGDIAVPECFVDVAAPAQ